MPLLHEVLVGARSSPLSRAQVKEVLQLLRKHRPEISFYPVFCETRGDKEKGRSLRAMEKSDFFTKELDEMLLQEECRAAVHSAKDLPEPLSEGLTLAAVTEGIDPSDSLVMREGESLESLPRGARVATSSERREAAVKTLRDDLTFIDLRGTIEERLQILETGKADAVVVAEAALLRLGMAFLNRISVPGETAEGQGRLAVVVRKDDDEMLTLFSPIDARTLSRT